MYKRTQLHYLITLGTAHLRKSSSAASDLEEHSTNLRAVRSFQMNSDRSLQFVVTRTFVGLLDAVAQTLRAGAGAGEATGDERELEREEDLVRENLMAGQLEVGEDDEDLSFGFLVKNELGVDVQIEAVAGFKVSFLVARFRSRDKLICTGSFFPTGKL